MDYATGHADDTAVAGTSGDYTTASGTLRFTPEDYAAKPVIVNTTGDDLVEGDETFTLALSGLNGGGGTSSLGTSSVANTITDYDTATLTISGPEDNVDEDGDSDAVFTITPSKAVAAPLTVANSTANGSVTAGEDYTAATDASVRIGGDQSLTQTITIEVLNDSLSELAEDFTVTLVSVTGGPAGLVTLSDEPDDTTATATIAASDAITVTLTGPADPVAEGTDATYTVTISGGVPRVRSDVDYVSGHDDDSSEAPGDYAATSGRLTFTPDGP